MDECNSKKMLPPVKLTRNGEESVGPMGYDMLNQKASMVYNCDSVREKQETGKKNKKQKKKDKE